MQVRGVHAGARDHHRIQTADGPRRFPFPFVRRAAISECMSWNLAYAMFNA